MNRVGAFHHAGIACRSVEREAAAYATLGYTLEGPEFDDSAHGIRGVFLVGPGPRIELVVDRPGSAVLEPWLRRGGGVYHLAFEVDDLTRAVEEQTRNAKLVVPPTPAVAFGGRRVAFVMLRNRMLVELVSRS